MHLTIRELPPALACAMVCAALSPPALAQRAGDEERRRDVPSMRESVSSRLAKAQECHEAGDSECARAELEEVRAMTNITGYERPTMWNVYAYIYVEQDDYPQAIRAYENLLAELGITVAQETAALYTLASLYLQQEKYEQALGALDRWFALAEAPGPNAYMLKAQTLYQLGRFADAVEPMVVAVEQAAEEGRAPEESWYQLLNALYFEIESYAKVLETSTFLAEHWPKAEYIKLLAGVYSQLGDQQSTLALYEAAYEAGWLESGPELVTLASLLLNADIPYKAARVLEKGLESGAVDPTMANWRLLAQAWQLAQEDEKALPAFARASALAPDGALDMLRAQSYANLTRWDECIEATEEALRRGLDRESEVQIIRGDCLTQAERFAEARAAFRAAARHEDSRGAVETWLIYVENEEARVRALEDMVRVR